MPHGGAHRAQRTAVYAVADPTLVPQALLHNLKHNQVLHETNVILNVAFHEHPTVDQARRVEVTALAPGFWRVLVHYGFMPTSGRLTQPAQSASVKVSPAR